MTNIQIVADEDVIDQTFRSISPFNLKNDFKTHFGRDYTQEKKSLIQDLSLSINEPTGNSVKRMALGHLEIENKMIYVVQVRMADQVSKKGKSGGFRCIVLLDKLINVGYLLHIFPKNKVDKIDEQERKKLNTLLVKYIYSK